MYFPYDIISNLQRFSVVQIKEGNRYCTSRAQNSQENNSLRRQDMTSQLLWMAQIFSSSVTTYQLHPPMASLSHSLYDMPGLAPRMNVLF